MKKLYILTLMIMALMTMVTAQTTHNITTSGLTFSPDSLNANVGDVIVFNVDFSTHPLQQVSSTTWAANQSTPLPGGFSANSGNTFSVTMNQAGTVYYVCTMHVSLGMKGRIFVAGTNGIEDIKSVAATSYPNPATQKIHIVAGTTGQISYTITDMPGRTILQGSESSNAQGMVAVDVSAIADGDYILTTNSGGVTSNSKIAIRH